jgi:UDP:flavonoid glycosyltransferase YjiC (YdhE family)
MQRRRRILFMAEGITMTHFARPAALAESLNEDEYEIAFWTPRRYHRLLRQPLSQLGDLRTIDPAGFLEALAHGRCLYTTSALFDYVLDDLRIFDAFRPDLVIGDFRLSLSISAPLRRIPFASIFNAQWSPYRRQPAVVPELPLTRWISPRLLGHISAALRPAFYALHARPVNILRRHFKLPFLSHDLREIYTAGDLVFYPDVPEFVPLSHKPPHHHFIGACSWSPAIPRPQWWEDVMAGSRPKIFVSLGSSGPLKALPAVIEAASQLGIDVLLSTSGRECAFRKSPRVHVANLLPYEESARNCVFVVSHGGTGGLYPALSAGTPMLAIPSNIDSHLSAHLLEESRAGLSVRVESASCRRIQNAMSRLLSERSFKNAALKWSRTFASCDTSKIFPQLLSNWFSSNSCPQQRETEPVFAQQEA